MLTEEMGKVLLLRGSTMKLSFHCANTVLLINVFLLLLSELFLKYYISKRGLQWLLALINYYEFRLLSPMAGALEVKIQDTFQMMFYFHLCQSNRNVSCCCGYPFRSFPNFLVFLFLMWNYYFSISKIIFLTNSDKSINYVALLL